MYCAIPQKCHNIRLSMYFLSNGIVNHNRVTRRGGYDPDVNRMARVIKKSGNRPAALYEDNITTTKVSE